MSANNKLPFYRLNHGFTLIEMAIVVLILGLLLGSILIPLSTQILNERIKSTTKNIHRIQDAIIGFAVINKRLPCPDTNGSGTENTPCTNSEGNVPWQTLGVGQFDAWGRPFRYRIDNNFMTTIPDPPDTSSGLLVQDRAGNSQTINDPNAPIAIIFSCGSDGLPNNDNDADGAVNTARNCTNPGTPNPTYTQDFYVENQFDDILTWISKNTLINQMVSAGKWP